MIYAGCCYQIAWGDVATWLIFIATTFYAGITYHIWQNTKATLKAANKTQQETKALTVALNNAYVGIESMNLTKNPKRPEQHGVLIIAKNYGNTPAFELRPTLAISSDRNELNTEIKKTKEVEGYEPPTLIMSQANVHQFFPLSEEEYDGAKAGNPILFVYVEQVYMGIDGGKYRSYSLHEYESATDSFVIIESTFEKWFEEQKGYHKYLP